MSETDLHAELEALRRDLAALRSARAGGAAPADSSGAAGEPTDGPEAAAAKEIRQMVQAGAAQFEKVVTAHPLPAAFGSFLVGLVIGRLFSR